MSIKIAFLNEGVFGTRSDDNPIYYTWGVYKSKIDKYAVGDVIRLRGSSKLFLITKIDKKEEQCDDCNEELLKGHRALTACKKRMSCYSVTLKSITNLEYLETLVKIRR
ncbi:MAG: hypothetical protein ACREBR_04955 [bacterium]